MQMVSIRDNVHEMSNLILCENKYFKMSSAVISPTMLSMKMRWSHFMPFHYTLWLT